MMIWLMLVSGGDDKKYVDGGSDKGDDGDDYLLKISKHL